MSQTAIGYDEEALGVRARAAIEGALRALVQPAVTVGAALVVGILVILSIGGDPVAAYANFLGGSFQSWALFGNMLAKSTPLITLGLCVVVAFRAGLFNIGGEGQMYLGAFWGAVAGLTFVNLPGPLLIVVVVLVAALVGGVWAAIGGVLKARWEVDEVVSTLLLNYVAILTTDFLVNNPFKDVTAGAPMTTYVANSAWLPQFIPSSSVTWGLPLALLAATTAWFIMFRTTWGADARAAGTNRRFAQAIGVNVRRSMIQAMFLSGALAGIGGAIEVLGVEHRFYQGFSPGFGFLGLTCALLGRLNPWGTIAMAFFYAMLLNGAAVMQNNTTVPFPLVNVLEGIIVLLMTAQSLPRLRGLIGAKRAAS